MANKIIKVTVQDTQNIIYQGEVDRISSYNDVGRFDVYAMHANFISIINKELVLYRDKQKVKELKIEQAVMKIKGDVAQIFLGIEALYLEDTNTPPAPEQKTENVPQK